MKVGYDESIYKEDMDMLLLTLTKRTISKKQLWNCVGYLPITFVDTSDSIDARAEISHTFYSDTILNEQLFLLALTDNQREHYFLQFLI